MAYFKCSVFKTTMKDFGRWFGREKKTNKPASLSKDENSVFLHVYKHIRLQPKHVWCSVRLRRTFSTPHVPHVPVCAGCVCGCLTGGHTYGGVEGEGALALVDSVSCFGDSDGGHEGDQQLSQVCSHLRIPASPCRVLRSLRSGAVRAEDAIFKAPPSLHSSGQARGDVTLET